MSTVPENFNFPAFFEAADKLKAEGHEVFNPAEEDLKTYGSLENTKLHANYRDCLRKDLIWICDYAEAMYVLPGWENSKGVKVELALANALKIPVTFL